MLLLQGCRCILIPNTMLSFQLNSPLPNLLPCNFYAHCVTTGLFLVVLFFMAVYLIKINTYLMIVESAHQVPGLFFVFLTGIITENRDVIPSTMAGLLLFMSLLCLFRNYKAVDTRKHCLNAGLLFSLAVIIKVKIVIFFPLLIAVLFIIRSVQWREIAIVTSGCLLPLFLVFTGFYLYGDYRFFIDSVNAAFTTTYSSDRYFSVHFFSILPLLAVAVFAIIVNYSKKMSRKESSRRFMSVIVVTTIVCMIFVISPFANNDAATMLYAPVSLLLTDTFVNSKSRFGLGVLLFMCVAVVLSQGLQISYYLSLP